MVIIIYINIYIYITCMGKLYQIYISTTDLILNTYQGFFIINNVNLPCDNTCTTSDKPYLASKSYW